MCFACVVHDTEFYRVVCVWCVDSCSMHNYAIFYFYKMSFHYNFSLSVSLKQVFVSKSTEQKKRCFHIYYRKLFVVLFDVLILFKILRSKPDLRCAFSFYFFFLLVFMSNFFALFVVVLHTLLLNITRSHVLLFVLFAVASNSSSTRPNEMLAPFASIRIWCGFFSICSRCTL